MNLNQGSRIVRQPDNWSCYACFAAMATGKELKDVVVFCGHDGSAILDTKENTHPDKRRGFDHNEIQRYLLSHELCLGGWMRIGEAGALSIGSEFAGGIYSVPGELVVTSKTMVGVCHSTYWNGELVFDPQEAFPTRLEDYEVLYFAPLVGAKKLPAVKSRPVPNKAFVYRCSVLGCGNGKCAHRQLDEVCPRCGYPMVEVTTTGFRFCGNPDTLYGCDYEEEPK